MKYFIIISGTLAKFVNSETREKVETDYLPHIKGNPDEIIVREITNVATFKTDVYNATKKYS